MIYPTLDIAALTATSKVSVLPRHLGIMMDGNGRWAKARGLPRLAGHRQGTENVRRVLDACADRGVRMVTLYVFSTENWGRPRSEMRGFFRLLAEVIDREVPNFRARGVRLRHLGSLEGVPPALARRVRGAVEWTRHNADYFLNVAFNYGGRADLLQAVRGIAANGYRPADLTADLIDQHLYTAGLPEIDLIVRTGAEMRLSNFFPWQGYRAVYYSPPAPWPDFDQVQLDRALQAYVRARVAWPYRNGSEAPRP